VYGLAISHDVQELACKPPDASRKQTHKITMADTAYTAEEVEACEAVRNAMLAKGTPAHLIVERELVVITFNSKLRVDTATEKVTTPPLLSLHPATLHTHTRPHSHAHSAPSTTSTSRCSKSTM
jgi:hypothetical protein